MAIQDYIGRKIDILAYYTEETGVGEVQLKPELAPQGTGGLITTGIQKLAQRFLLELLTEKGSMLYLPTRGCDFMKEARLGYLRTPLDVMASFSAALSDIKRNLRLEESATDAADEKLASAEVLSVSLSGDKASVHVQVLSQAGTTRTVVAPLAVTI
jgi:hypothetical protein